MTGLPFLRVDITIGEISGNLVEIAEEKMTKKEICVTPGSKTFMRFYEAPMRFSSVVQNSILQRQRSPEMLI
jgi:hypothetical protein